MPKLVVVNCQNHMGDAMCQMRGLKELQDREPGLRFDYVTCFPLHYAMAAHTDLFEVISMASREGIDNLVRDPYIHGYDGQIEFRCDWAKALAVGILRSWVETTLNFTPSTDKPYFLLTETEKTLATAHVEQLRRRGFRKIIAVQLEAPSDLHRSVLPEDYGRVLAMVPRDVLLLWSGPVTLALDWPYPPRANLVLLPGYDIGTFGALLQRIDGLLTVHGGQAMLAHALDVTNVVHLIYTEVGSANILWVPAWQNLVDPSNRQTNWTALEQAIRRLVA